MSGYTLVLNEQHKTLISEGLLLSREEVLLSSAIIKDFLILLEENNKPIKFSELVKILVNRGVRFKIITTPKMKTFYFFKNLKGFNDELIEFRFCARMHMKLLVVDTLFAYVGSANFTGAGLGMKGENKRNFEAGVVITNKKTISRLKKDFQEIWSGKNCMSCKLRDIVCEGIQ